MSDALEQTISTKSNKREKGYKTKPILIEVFALIYLLNPIGNVMSLMFLNFKNTPFENLQMLWGHILSGNLIVIVNVILWFSAIPLAYGLFKVHLWAWYYFLIHSISMVVVSLFDGAGNVAPSIATLINILFLIPIGFFISKEIRTPYFNPDVRWWEQSLRYHHVVSITVDGNVFDTYDLSDTGAFIICDNDLGYQSSELVPISMTVNDTLIECFAEIIWHKTKSDVNHPAGYGIKFTKMSFPHKQEIKRYIKSLQTIGKKEAR